MANDSKCQSPYMTTRTKNSEPFIKRIEINRESKTPYISMFAPKTDRFGNDLGKRQVLLPLRLIKQDEDSVIEKYNNPLYKDVPSKLSSYIANKDSSEISNKIISM